MLSTSRQTEQQQRKLDHKKALSLKAVESFRRLDTDAQLQLDYDVSNPSALNSLLQNVQLLGYDSLSDCNPLLRAFCF
jgi:hypothetical protein